MQYFCMRYLNGIKYYLKNPESLLLRLASIGILKMDDKKYVCMLYKEKMGCELSLTSPQLFNEKIQFLKLYDRNPLYSRLVDKYKVKKWIAEKIGQKYVIRTLGVWDSFDDIDFNKLPNQFVLKCTHDSGGVVIVKDKKHFSKANAKKNIREKFEN